MSSHLILEGLSHFRPGAVKKHSLVCLRQIQGVTSLFGGEALDIPHRDHCPLRRRQVVDRALHHLERLLGEEPTLWRPRLRRSGPVTRKALARADEAVCVDRPLTPVVAERRERNAARLAHASRLRRVGDTPIEPGLERRATLEPTDASEHADPRFRDDILCHGATRDVHLRDTQHPGAVHPHHSREGSLITGAQPFDEQCILRREELRHHTAVTPPLTPKTGDRWPPTTMT